MQNVLVTGSTGFVGLPLADRLVAEGCAVVGYDPVPAPNGHEFETIRGDLQDVHEICRILDQYDVDTVIHSGAVSGSMLLRDDPLRIAQLNMFGTTHLIEAARAVGVPKFVYISSSSAYGNTPPGPVDVDAPMRPGSVYSATKGAGDLLVMAYRTQFDMNIVSLRIGGLYGPGRRTWCVIKTMVENAVAGEPTHFDWGADQSRIHLYIDETVRSDPPRGAGAGALPSGDIQRHPSRSRVAAAHRRDRSGTDAGDRGHLRAWRQRADVQA